MRRYARRIWANNEWNDSEDTLPEDSREIPRSRHCYDLFFSRVEPGGGASVTRWKLFQRIRWRNSCSFILPLPLLSNQLKILLGKYWEKETERFESEKSNLVVSWKANFSLKVSRIVAIYCPPEESTSSNENYATCYLQFKRKYYGIINGQISRFFSISMKYETRKKRKKVIKE